jgi:hypothetical protein
MCRRSYHSKARIQSVCGYAPHRGRNKGAIQPPEEALVEVPDHLPLREHRLVDDPRQPEELRRHPVIDGAVDPHAVPPQRHGQRLAFRAQRVDPGENDGGRRQPAEVRELGERQPRVVELLEVAQAWR